MKKAMLGALLLALPFCVAQSGHAQARQSYFSLACDAGLQAQLTLSIVYAHTAMMIYNYCPSGGGATKPWLYPTTAYGEVKELTATLTMVETGVSTPRRKSCTLVNGAQALRCQFPDSAAFAFPKEVLFEYAID